MLTAARQTHAVPPPAAARTVRVGLAGLGPVGRGLVDLLERESDGIAARHGLRFEIARVLVRDAARPREGLGRAALVADAIAFLAPGLDLVVEAIGGAAGAALDVARGALARGLGVVTANKALVAERGEELRAIARETGAAFRYEASVAAGIPLLSVIERSLLSTAISRITGVLNATSNCVLSDLARGGSFAASVERARAAGFAERDASDDLSGRDAARKLALLARAAAGRPVECRFEVEGIEDVTREDVALAAARLWRIRPIARAAIEGGVARGFVAPALVPIGDPLALLEGAENGVRIEGDTIGSVFFSGPGGGPTPTAASLVDDLIAAATEGHPLPVERKAALPRGAARADEPPRRERLASGRAYRVLETGGIS